MNKYPNITGHILAITAASLVAMAIFAFCDKAEAATSDANSPDWIRAKAPAEKPSQAPLVEPQEDLDPPPSLPNEVRLFIDKRTGCHWFVTGWFGQPATVTPRLYSDGAQVCD